MAALHRVRPAACAVHARRLPQTRSTRCCCRRFGAATPLSEITTEAIDAYRERLLAEGRLSRRTIQKALVLLHGILKRAQRRKWIGSNPAADAERVNFKRSGDFNVLTPEQIRAVVGAIDGGRRRPS